VLFYQFLVALTEGHGPRVELTPLKDWTSFWESGYAGGVGRMGSSGAGSGGEGEEAFTGRAALGYDHGYDGEVFYLGLALDPAYIEGFVEGCLERIGEKDPDEEQLFRDLWEDEGERESVLEALKADCELRPGRPVG
jgi:hypothetical protein